MLRRLAVVLVWFVAVLGTATLTYAAVSSAGRAVGANPATPVAGSEIAARISTTTLVAVADSSTTTAVDSTTSAPSDGPATTAPATTTTSSGGQPTTINSTTTTTTPSSTTTSGAATQHWKTVPGVGTVGVSVSGTTVMLVSATPVTPFHVDVEDDGPETVEVEFDSDGADYKVRARVQDGELVWEVDQSGDDGDEGDG